MPDLTINRRLNIVIPVERPGKTIYVHSTPISRETFENYDVVLGRTFAAIFELGVGESAGPNLAWSMLKRLSKQLSLWDEVQNGLLPEMHRLTNVLAPGEDPLPWQIAVQRGVLDEDDAAEVTGALVFFMVVSAVSKRSQVAARLESPGRLWGFALTPLNATEFLGSLPTSMQAEPSGAKTVASSVPS